MKIKNQKLIFDMLLDKQCLNQTIENLAELLDLSTSAISSYHKTPEQKGYRNATVSGEEFYNRVFAKIGKNEMEQTSALQSMCKYLKDRKLFSSELNAYAQQGYKTFIQVLLSFDMGAIPCLSSDQAGNPAVSSGRLAEGGLNDVFPPLSLKVFGRKDLLEQIHAMLYNNGIVLLHGIGGIGKSCISLKYIDSYKDNYRHIQHVYFEKSIKRTILKLSFYGLNEENKTDDEKFHIRMNELYKCTSDTLLVIDNMDIKAADLDAENYSELKRSKIHLLITSRYGTTFEADENIIGVNTLSESDQKELFQYHYKAKLPANEEPLMRDIFSQVGGHTLLIELIAKTMRDGDIEIQEMLNILKGDYEEADSIVYIEKDQKKVSFTMDQYVGLLFDISNLSGDEKDTLKLLSLIPLEGISRKLFKSLSGKNNNATISLTHSSWVITEANEDSKYRLRLHPVICKVVLDKTLPDFQNCSVFLENLKIKLHEHANHAASDKTDLSNLVHNLIDVLDCRTGEELEFFLYAATRLREFCDYSHSIDIFRFLIARIHEIEKELSIEGYQNLLQKIYVESAQVYIRLAHYPDAIDCYTGAVNLLKKDAGTSPMELADLYNRLGFVYRKSSEYEKALEFYEKSKKLLSELPEMERNPILGDTYNDLGIVYINKKDYQNALRCYKKGLSIRNHCLPKDSLKLAYSYHNIGTVYQRLNDFESALENHKMALQIREECPEPPVLEIAASYAQIGNDYTSSNQFDEAIAYYNKAREIRTKYLHKDHPDIAWIDSSIGDWHFKQGEYGEAKKMYQQTLAIRRVSLGGQHAYTAEALYKLGCCCRKLHQPQKAEQYLTEARQIQEAKNLSVALQATQRELDTLLKS